MTIFFTSDTHFFHSNIIKYCKRPFQNSTEQNETIIKNWNSVVAEHDSIYHLGDFSFSNRNLSSWIASRLNGHIFLLLGNHDKKGKLPIENDKLQILGHYYELKIKIDIMKNKHQLIILCHYPFEVWNKKHYEAWHLHGHSHGNIKGGPHLKRLDVGMDCHNFFPVSFEDIDKRLMCLK